MTTLTDEATLLEQNAVNLKEDLLREIRGYEARYELDSSRLEEDLAAGRLRDTAEITRWVIAWRALGELTAGNARRSARLG